MKRRYILLLVLILIFKPKPNYAQGDDIATAAAGLLAIGGVIASMENAEEQLELGATEWVLKNTNMTQFNIETILLEGSKLGDVSRSSFVPFKLYEYEVINMADGTQEYKIVSRYVLMMYSFSGFITDNGIDYTNVRYELIDKEIWFKRMKGYIMAASNAPSTLVDELLENGTVLAKGVTSSVLNKNGKPYSNNYSGDDLAI